jgi:hypothetical protein
MPACRTTGASKLPLSTRSQVSASPASVVNSTAPMTAIRILRADVARSLTRSPMMVGMMCHNPNAAEEHSAAIGVEAPASRHSANNTPRKITSSVTAVPTGIRTSTYQMSSVRSIPATRRSVMR